jgi:hypothetical protein
MQVEGARQKSTRSCNEVDIWWRRGKKVQGGKIFSAFLIFVEIEVLRKKKYLFFRQNGRTFQSRWVI